MQAHDPGSRPSDFSHNLLQQEQRIRENLAFVGPANRSMQQGIEAARRKLNSSASTGILRSQQDNRYFVSRPQRDQLSQSQTPQHATHSVIFRKQQPQVPEQVDDQLGLLRREVVVLRRENEGLKQVMAQSDASARFAIAQLQNALDAAHAQNQRARVETERVRNAFENASKQTHDEKPISRIDSPCLKCPRLEASLRELEAQFEDLNRQLKLQITRKSELSQANESFRSEMSIRLQNMQGQLRTRNHQILELQQKNLELSRRMTQRERQLNQQITNITQEYYSANQAKQKAVFQTKRLNAQIETIQKRYKETSAQLTFISSKVEALAADAGRREEREQIDFRASISQLQEKLTEMRYRLQERESETRELEAKLSEKNSHFLRLSEEYSNALQRIEQLEENGVQFRTRNEELQAELQRMRRRELPASLDANQLLKKYSQLEQMFYSQRQSTQQMQEQLQNRQRTIVELQAHLKQATESYHKLQTYSESEIRKLTDTITTLVSQNKAITQQNLQLQLSISKRGQQEFSEARQQAVTEREELIRRLQQSQAALEQISKQPLTDYKRIGELEELVSTLRQQLQEYKSILANADNYRRNLVKENHDLNQEINKYRIKLREKEHNDDQSRLQSLNRQVTVIEEDKNVLKKQIRDLIFEKQAVQSNLEKAQNYIITLMEQIKANNIANDSILTENKSLSVEKRTLLEENQTLHIKLQQLLKQRQINTPITLQEDNMKDTYVSIELANLRIKNEQLENRLSSAVSFINSLQSRVQQLLEQQQHATNALLHQRESKSQIERIVLIKEAIIERQTLEFRNQIAHRDQIIQNLQRRVEEGNRLNPSLSSQNQQQVQFINLQSKNKQLYTHLENAENYIATLQEQISSIKKREEQVKSILTQERQAKILLEQSLSVKAAQKDRTIYDLRQELQNVNISIKTLTAENRERLQKQNLMQLENLANSLKWELNQRQSVISNAETDRAKYLREIETLKQQVIHYKQHVCQREEISDQSGREALKSLKYQNQILAKQNRELLIKVQEGQTHLEKAENYIAQMLDKYAKQDTSLSNQTAKLRLQIQKLTEQRRQREIELESQVRLRKELQVKVDQMNIFVVNCKEQFERNAEEAKRELRILQEMCGAVPRNDDFSQKGSPQKQPKRPDLENPSQISKTEWLHVQNQNQVLRKKLRQAEDYISHINQQLKNKQKALIQVQTHANKIQQSYKTLQISSQTEIRKLRESINQVKDVVMEKQAIQTHLIKAEQYIATLLEQIKAKDSVLVLAESAITDNKTLSLEKQTLMEENQTLRIQIDQLSKQRTTFTQQNRDFSNQIANRDKNIAMLQKKIEEMGRQKVTIDQSKQKELLQSKKKVTLLESQVSVMIQQKKQAQKIKISIKNEANAIVVNAKRDYEALRQQFNRVSQQKEDEHEHLLKAETYISSLLAEIQQYKKSSPQNENQSLIHQNQLLLADIRKLTELQQSLSSQNQALNKQLQQISAEKQTVFNQNQRLSQQVQQISAQKQQLNHTIQSYKVQMPQPNLIESTQFSNLQKVNAQLLDHLQKAERHIALQQNQINSLKQKDLSNTALLSRETQAKFILQKTLSVTKAQIQAERKKNVQLQDVFIVMKNQSAQQQKKISNMLIDHDNLLQQLSVLKQLKTPEPSQDASNPKLLQVQQQNQALKKKLMQAEDYIYHIEQELPQTEARAKQLQEKIIQALEKNKELSNINEQLLQQINRSPDRQISSEGSPLDNSGFFREKLLQAESYIHEMESENSRILAEINGKQNEVNILREEISKLNKLLLGERQQNRTKLQDTVNNIKLKEKQLVQLKQVNSKLQTAKDSQKDTIIIQLKEKLQLMQNAKTEVERIIKAQQVQTNSLRGEAQQSKQKVQSLQKRINQLQKEKQTANQRADYSQGLLMQTVKRLQEQKSQNNPAQITVLKDNLNQAETYITQLEAVNQSLKNQLAQQATNYQNQEAKLTYAQNRSEKAEQELMTVLQKLDEAQSYIFTLSTENEKIKQDLLPNAGEIDHLKAKLSEVEGLIDGAESENKNLREKLAEAQTYIRTQDQETRVLKSKLTQVEAHIEEDRNKLKSKLAQAQQQIRTLQQQRNKLKARQISSSPQKQPKKDESKQQVAALQQQIRRLNLEREINSDRLQSKQAQIKALSSALQNLTQSKTTVKPQEPEQDANFFRSKLLQAEQYIEQIEHVNMLNEQTLTQQSEEVKQLAAKNSSLENALSKAEKGRNTLIAELNKEKDINNRLKQAATKQISPTQIVSLQNRIDQLQKKLADSDANAAKQLKNNQQLAKQISQLTNSQAALRQEKADSDEQATFFKSKLFQAENYITQLEQAGNTNEELANKIKQIMLLQDKLKEAEKSFLSQAAQSERKEARLAKLEKKVHENEEESQFFRKKLLQAQTYINHLEQTIPKVDDATTQQLKQKLAEAEQAAKNWQGKSRDAETKNKELSLMNEQLMAQLDERRPSEEIRRLQDSLIQLRSALNESEANNRNLQSRIAEGSVGSRVTSDPSQQEKESSGFFKNKLLQAESYIRELQQENKRFGEKMDEMDALRQELDEANRALQEMQERNNVLAVEVDRLQHQRAQQTENISTIQGELAGLNEQRAAHIVQVKQITYKLHQAERKLSQTQHNLTETQQQLQRQALGRQQAENNAKKYEQLSHSLQDTLNIIDNIPTNIESTASLDKLREAELTIAELTAKAEQKDSTIATLNAQLAEALQNNQIIDGILTNLAKQLAENKQTLQELQSRQDLSRSIPCDQSGNPIAPKTHLHQREEREAEESKHKIEKQFLGEKLKQAEELIVQQQNEIMRLTDEIVRLQNDSSLLKRKLSSHRREEQEMEEAIRQLSSSRQDLVQKIQPLENANEALRNQIRQAKQTIADLQEQKQIIQAQSVHPLEEQHQKIIELEAEVLQLKENNRELETLLQQARAESDGLSQKIVEQEELKKKLQQTKPNTEELDSLTEKLVAEVMKTRQLQRELSEKEELNGQLQTAIREANESVQEMQNHIQNLNKAHSKTIATLHEQAEKAAVENAALNAQLKQKEEIIQNLVPLAQQKQQLLKESGDLKQTIKILQTEKEGSEELLAKLTAAEAYIAELEQSKNDADAVLKKLLSNMESFRQQSEGLTEDLRKANAEKQRLLSEIKNLQEEVQMAQSDNERLNSKISYLNSLNEVKDQEIANLSQISKEREREIERLQKSSSNIIQHPETPLQHPLPKEGNIIPDEYKEEIQEEESSVRELADQIRSLTAQLQRREEENRQLMVERVNLQGEITELHQVQHDEELRQHLVETDRLNLQLENENQQLRDEIEALAKDKAYLECELNQIKQKSPIQVPQLPLTSIHTEQTPIISENEAVSALRDENMSLKEQLQELRARTQELIIYQVENDSLKHLKQALEQKLQAADAEKNRLLQKLALAEQALATQSPLAPQSHEQELARKEEQLASAYQRIDELQAHFEEQRKQEALGEGLKKLLDLSNFNEDIDEDVMQQLQNYPYLHEFINSLLYRLRLSSALQLEKSLKIKQITQELQAAQKDACEAKDLRAGNEFLREEIARLQEERRGREKQEQAKYDEALQQLLYYSSLNKELQTKLAEISQIAQQQEKRIKGYEQQISPLDTSQPSQENDLSQQNYELRRRLESSQRQLQKYRADSSSSLNSKEVFYMQFLKSCLDKVVDLEHEVQQVERQIERTAAEGTHRSQPSHSHQEDTLQERLQQLQQKLVRNAQNIREHQQRSDNELFQLLRELSELKELPEASRNRIDEYLSQLQAQILREHDQHQSEVSRLREQVAALSQQSARSNQSPQHSPRGTREELLREITHLNNAIEIYYQQSMRRKKNYRRTIEGLFADIEHLRLKQLQGSNEEAMASAASLAQKLADILEREEDEDARQLQMGDDFIISGNQMQILDSREKTPLPALESHQEKGTQTEQDPKPFLAFLLGNPSLEKEDLRLLKKKVAELRGREVEESLQALRGQERRLQQVLQLGARDPPQQMENIMLTLANTYSRDEISQIFGSEDNDEILNKLNEALCLQESFYRGENSTTMLQNILQRKNRYYQSPTKLSEEVYNHLITLLSAKRDDEFYDEIDALFHDLYQTEIGFEEALKKKDQMYREHNQRMNQIFNRSSSDGSEQYMNVFENNPNHEQLEMHSERKPRRSEPDQETER